MCRLRLWLYLPFFFFFLFYEQGSISILILHNTLSALSSQINPQLKTMAPSPAKNARSVSNKPSCNFQQQAELSVRSVNIWACPVFSTYCLGLGLLHSKEKGRVGKGDAGAGGGWGWRCSTSDTFGCRTESKPAMAPSPSHRRYIYTYVKFFSWAQLAATSALNTNRYIGGVCVRIRCMLRLPKQWKGREQAVVWVMVPTVRQSSSRHESQWECDVTAQHVKCISWTVKIPATGNKTNQYWFFFFYTHTYTRARTHAHARTHFKWT